MSLLAGAERYPYRHFLLYDVTGETLGAVIPLSPGYALGACWEAGATYSALYQDLPSSYSWSCSLSGVW